MKRLILTMAIAAAVGISGSTFAGSKKVIDDDFSRMDPDTPSNDGVSTVRNNCGGGTEAWDDASATLEVKQKGETSEVEIEVEDAKPNTYFTVWLRIKGKNGLNSGGTPLTGGGATPMAPGTALDDLNAESPWNNLSGSDTVANGFFTDDDGEGELEIDLDFPLVGGAYPFQKITGIAHPTKDALLPNVPTAIADPRVAGQGSTAFLLRMVSHCQDGKGHGLAPSVGSNPGRESWFQYP